MPKLILLLAFLLLLCINSCSSKTDRFLIDYFAQTISDSTMTITVPVMPDSLDRVITITRGNRSTLDTVDQFTILSGTLRKQSTILPKGYYCIEAIAEGHGRSYFENHFPGGENWWTNSFTLRKSPFPLSSTTPRDGDTLRSYTIGINLADYYTPEQMRSLITLTPAIPYTFEVDHYKVTNPRRIFVNPEIACQYDSITLSFSDTVQSSRGTYFDFPYSFTFPIDKAHKEEATFTHYINRVFPMRPIRDINPFDDVMIENHYSRSSEIKISFRRDVVQESIDESISFFPHIEGTFFVDSIHHNRVLFRPDTLLNNRETYTVTIDTTLRFIDSSNVITSFSWEFWTD